MKHPFGIGHLASRLGMCGFVVLAVSTALAGSGHGAHSSGGSRGFTSSRGRGRTMIGSTAGVGAIAPTQRSGIQACPIPPNGCPPGSRVNGCRRYCPAQCSYFFGHYSFLDEYCFGQYYYRDTYAAAYQPQIAPDSYYQQLGQQWGADVKNGSVPKERLIALIEVQIINAPQHSQNSFRRGFLAGYGTGGETFLAQIVKQAK